jgi:hypothetical protein
VFESFDGLGYRVRAVYPVTRPNDFYGNPIPRPSRIENIDTAFKIGGFKSYRVSRKCLKGINLVALLTSHVMATSLRLTCASVQRIREVCAHLQRTVVT